MVLLNGFNVNLSILLKPIEYYGSESTTIEMVFNTLFMLK